MHYLSGHPINYAFDSCGVPIKIVNGLPRILPRGWRHSIRCGSVSKIRYILSLLYIYKSLSAQPTCGQSPYAGMLLAPIDLCLTEFERFVGYYFKGHKRPIENLRPKAFLASIKAGPVSPLGVAGLGADCAAWMQRDESGSFPVDPLAHPFHWLKLVGDTKVKGWIRLWSNQFLKGKFDTPYVLHLAQRKSSAYGLWKYLKNLGVAHEDPKVIKSWASGGSVNFSSLTSLEAAELEKLNIPIPVGRSHVLHEACGKKRLIAIIDGVRQALFKPLHDDLFAVISKFFGENSAIHSQAESVRRFAQKKYKYTYSFDISKATDTISRKLYLPILSILYTPEIAKSWEALLTGYEFITESESCSKVEKIRNGTNRLYGRGQPMGGYSSFAMLDLLHHMLIQYSAYTSGLRVTCDAPFKDYCVLGDDVVIGDPNVAQAYLDTCQYFCIPISKGKSYQSNTGFFSFVSEVFIEDVCLSPLSLRADLIAKNIAERFEYATKAMERGYQSFAPSKLFNSVFRLMLHKNQFKAEMERLERGSVSTLSHRVLGALSIICNGAQGLSISYWLRKAVSPLGVSELRGERKTILDTEISWMVTVLRQLIYNRTKALSYLLTAEAAAVNQWLTYFVGNTYKIMEANEKLKFVLDCQCSCPDWINFAFVTYVSSLDITPDVTAVPKGDGPFAHLLFKKTVEERELSSFLSKLSLKSIDNMSTQYLVISKIFDLMRESSFFKRVLKGSAFPYDLVRAGETALQVSEKEDTLGHS